MSNFILFVIIIFISIGSSFGECTDDRAVINQKFAKETLTELNILRSNPIGYFNKTSYVNKNNKISKPCNDGAQESLDLIKELIQGSKLQVPIDPLVLNDKLSRAATDYAEYLAINNVFDHHVLKTPSDRCKNAGYTLGCGENLAANSDSRTNVSSENANIKLAAQIFIEQLARDCNVSNRGHLKAMLNANYKSVGVGFFHYDDSKYKNYTAQNFGTEK